MPRATRSTPSLPAEVAHAGPTALASAPPANGPDPKPNRASATLVDPSTPLESLPCYTPGALGAGVVLDLSRVFLASGNSCAVGSRHEIACSLGWMASQVPPRPGAEAWPQVLEVAERKTTTVRAGASRAYRELEATRILVLHILDLLLYHNLLLLSEHCVILHGASEFGGSGGAERQPGGGGGGAGSPGAGDPLVDDIPSFGARARDTPAASSAAGAASKPNAEAKGQEASSSSETLSKDDKDLLGLTTTVHHAEFQQLIVDVSRVWRNSKGTYDWGHFERALRAAADLAGDTGLDKEKTILERTITRGQFIYRRFSCPAVTLGVFTDKLPNTRGLSRSQIDQDLKDGRAIQKALGPGAVSGGSLKSKSGAGNRKGGGGKGGSGGGGGSAPPQPPSNRALAAIARFNGLMQDEQQQFQPVPGGPTCDRCSAAGRNPNHDHKICAFFTCSRCKRVGHRSTACPYQHE